MAHDKRKLLERLLEQMVEGSNVLAGAASNARQASIDAPGAMVSRYDSAKEEQGYLADSLNLRHAEKVNGAGRIRSTPLPQNPQSVAVGTLVRLENRNGLSDYFVLPYGGGEFIETDEGDITVVTPSAPIFKAMQGRRVGEDFVFSVRGRQITYRVLELS
ncbi:MAG: hypothetical protein ABH864_03655 [archaeon]